MSTARHDFACSMFISTASIMLAASDVGAVLCRRCGWSKAEHPGSPQLTDTPKPIPGWDKVGTDCPETKPQALSMEPPVPIRDMIAHNRTEPTEIASAISDEHLRAKDIADHLADNNFELHHAEWVRDMGAGYFLHYDGGTMLCRGPHGNEWRCECHIKTPASIIKTLISASVKHALDDLP